ncbi:MAG: hypothetical protein IPJ34_27885 [Myxococcales bacterium]|nr:hypothetical protein [Myxococcales bacterium]
MPRLRGPDPGPRPERAPGKTLLAHAIAQRLATPPGRARACWGERRPQHGDLRSSFAPELGAYSGATGKRAWASSGSPTAAHGLILDEVLNLSPNAQKILLDFTQFRT